MARTDITTFRKFNNEKLPRWYRPDVHVLVNLLILAASAFSGFYCLDFFNLTSVGLIGVFLICWSFIEYGTHRHILHGSLLSKTHLQKQHSVFHHGYFTYEDIEANAAIDINRIILFSHDMLILMLANGLIGYILTLIFNKNIGALFFIAGVIYLVLYETIHSLCHTKHSWLQGVVQHHRLHHDQTLMGRKNFSVVIPLVDSIFGSRTKPGER